MPSWSDQAISLLVLDEETGGWSGIFGYSPAPGAGNLVFSLAAAAGTDPYGNTYPAGLSTTAGNSTIEGDDYLLNSSGAFFYNGKPAAGNLIASIAAASGTDPFGNAYSSGLMFGGTASAHFQVDDNGVAYFYNAAGTNIIRINPSRQAMYFYDSAGQLLVSLAAAAGTDPVTGSAVPVGITAGTSSNPQVQITSTGGTGQILFLLPSSAYADALIESGVVSGYAQLLIAGPTLASHPDWISHEMNSSAGTGSANEVIIYNTPVTPSSPYQMAHVDSGGFSVDAGLATGAAPGASPATGDSWHGLGAPAGWSGSGRYVKMAERQAVWVDIDVSPGSSGQTSGTFQYSMGAGWAPVTGRNYPAAINASTAANARIYVGSNGVVQVLGLPSGFTGDVSASFMIPLD